MSKTNGTSKSSPELQRLPKASDLKLPKRLTKIEKEMIRLGREINKSLHEAYLNEQKAKR